MTTEDKIGKIDKMCSETPNCNVCNVYRAGLQRLCTSPMNEKNADLLYSAAFPDNVNHPAHYQGAHECIEVMQAMFGVEAVKAFCRCNAFKYRFRADWKGGVEDIKKAEWYEDYLMKLCDSERKEHT